MADELSAEPAAKAVGVPRSTLAAAPFPVRGVQVTTGRSSWRRSWTHCRTSRLELVASPPKQPDLNGAVARAQSCWRYEFYASYDLPNRIDKLQPLLAAFAHRFNSDKLLTAASGFPI
jgi:hypothetical protein